MAPPRQQRTTVADDSRSEASSGPRESKPTTAKGRKGANGANSRADGKIAAGASSSMAAANITSAPAQQQQMPEELPNINWSDMPLEILHSYRHAFNLPIPSAYSRTYSHLLLSQGIGLRSPTSIAVQRSQLVQQQQQQQRRRRNQDSNRLSSSSKKVANGTRHHVHHHRNYNRHHNNTVNTSVIDEKNSLHRIISQNRVSKDQLALAVRKHFNSAGLAEQETIAKFLYKVREEGKGRQFRLRFQP